MWLIRAADLIINASLAPRPAFEPSALELSPAPPQKSQKIKSEQKITNDEGKKVDVGMYNWKTNINFLLWKNYFMNCQLIVI